MDETDQFEDNRTKVVASRCANSTMMKGYVKPFLFFFKPPLNNNITQDRRTSSTWVFFH